MNVTLPQVWTSETIAVRMLAALAIVHPAEFSKALSEASGHKIDGIDTSSVRCEKHRTDMYFTTVDRQEILIEAKIDDYISNAQLDNYWDRFPTAEAILLVASIDSPDVIEVRKQRPRVKVASWYALLSRLLKINPIAKQLLDDILKLADLPGTKARVRKQLAMILDEADHSSDVRAELGITAHRYPCIVLSVPQTWIFGQVEAKRNPHAVPKYQAKVGFRTGESDEAGEPMQRMHQALNEAWAASVQLEHDGRVMLSRASGPSTQQRKFHIDQPYMARGYQNDYVGVATLYTADAREALAWATALSETFADVSLRIWGGVDTHDFPESVGKDKR